MAGLSLIAPTMDLEAEYQEMLEEWKSTGEELIPFVLEKDPTDFSQMVAQLQGFSQGQGIPKNFVSHATYWLVDATNQIIGVVNIRPRLNEKLLQRGGHIGYGIRPSERRKGYATRMLQLALEKARTLGIEKALVTCDKRNIASAKVIVNNGGKLDCEAVVDGVLIQRYWIELSSGRG